MIKDHFDQLKLENQICFPLYAVSRLVIQQYKPLLDTLGVTYPQYLVLLVLWEKDEIPVKEISEKLLLETNTLTPLLKRMEKNGLLKRSRSVADERVVVITLTEEGRALFSKSVDIPEKLGEKLKCLSVSEEEFFALKDILDRIVKEARSS